VPATVYQIEVDYSLPDDSVDGDVEIYRSGSSGSLGTLVETRDPSDPTVWTDSGLEEATPYWYTVRRVTDHASVDAPQVKQYSKPALPLNLEVVSIASDDAGVEWFDASENEDGHRLSYSTDGGANYTVDADLAADSESHAFTGLPRPNNLTLRVQTYVGSGSEEESQATTTSLYLPGSAATETRSRGWYVEVDIPGADAPLRPVVIGEPEWVPVVNDLPRISLPVERSDRWLSASLRGEEMRVWKDGVRLPIDSFASGRVEPGRAIINGTGGEELLEEAGTYYEQSPVDDVVTDLIGLTSYTTGVDDTVSDVTPGQVILDLNNGTDFENNITNVSDTDPIVFTANSVRLGQTCYWGTNDGGDALPSGSFTEVSDGQLTDDNWEDADALLFNGGSDYANFTFDLDYTIPAANVGCTLRKGFNGNHSWTLTVDGEEVADFDSGGTNIDMRWDPDWVSGNFPYDLGPGNVTVTYATDSVDDYVNVDAVVLYDTRYHSDNPPADFDDQIETDTEKTSWLYLDDPVKFGTDFTIVTNDATPSESVSGGTCELSVTDTTGTQQIELSNDSGSTYPISGSNTGTVDGDFGSLGATLRARVTLSPYGTEASESPANDYNGQEISGLTLKADLDDTPLVINTAFDTSIIDALKQLAEYADALFEVVYDVNDGFTVSWTQPGQRENTTKRDVADYSYEKNVEESPDRVYVVGGRVHITRETFTSNHGTAVSLSEENLVKGSESVYDSSTDTVYTDGDDYTIDNLNGEITTLSSGAMSDSTEYTIDFDFKHIGKAERAGASSPYTVRKFEFPGLTTQAETGLAARRIRRALSVPTVNATVTIRDAPAGWSVLDNLNLSNIPVDDPQNTDWEVRRITTSEGSSQIQFESAKSAQDVLQLYERKLQALGRQV